MPPHVRVTGSIAEMTLGNPRKTSLAISYRGTKSYSLSCSKAFPYFAYPAGLVNSVTVFALSVTPLRRAFCGEL
jgi:hypothetical protein